MDKMLYVAMTGAKQLMQAQGISPQPREREHDRLSRRPRALRELSRSTAPAFRRRVNTVAREHRFRRQRRARSPTPAGDLDVAIDGSGWIAVQAADGKEAYTRMGNLRLTRHGPARDRRRPAGARRQRPDRDSAEQRRSTIGGDGTISIVPQGHGPETVSRVSRIKLVDPDRKQLVKGDDGLCACKIGRNGTRLGRRAPRLGRARVEQRQSAAGADQHDRAVAPLRSRSARHVDRRTDRSPGDEAPVAYLMIPTRE